MDFAGGVVDGVIHDMSTYQHHATVRGVPTFVDGGYPEKPYEAPKEKVGKCMYTENSNQYLIIPDSEELRMGENDADFTISWAMK